MSEAIVHECPDGRRFRINKIQEIRDQPFVQGVRYAFQVNSEVEDSASSAETAGAEAFDVAVSFAPIYMSIASPQARQDLDARAVQLVADLLDGGHRQQAEVEVTSDGAAKLGDSVIGRLYALA
jgi:hypothetical protein